MSQQTYDEFLEDEFKQIAQPDEKILGTCLGWFGPGVWAQAILLGGLLAHLLMKFHFAILTNQRLILIRTKSGILKLKKENRGVETITADQLQQVKLKGAMMQKRLEFVRNDGTKRVFRMNKIARQVTGQKAFPEAAVAEMNRQIQQGVTGEVISTGEATSFHGNQVQSPAPMRWIFLIPIVFAVLLFGFFAINGGEDELVGASYLAVPLAVAGIAGWIYSKRQSSLKIASIFSGVWGLSAIGSLMFFYVAIWPSL